MAKVRRTKRRANWEMLGDCGSDEEIGGPRPVGKLPDTPMGRYCRRLESRVTCRDAIIAAQDELRMEDEAALIREKKQKTELQRKLRTAEVLARQSPEWNREWELWVVADGRVDRTCTGRRLEERVRGSTEDVRPGPTRQVTAPPKRERPVKQEATEEISSWSAPSVAMKTRQTARTGHDGCGPENGCP